MSTAQPITAARMGRVFEDDLELHLPERPRFLPELRISELGEAGLLVLGSRDAQVLRGSAARKVIPALVALLDGTHDLDELEQATGRLGRRRLIDAIALLHSRGLLEDGDPGPAPTGLQDADAFIGRHVDVTRVNPSRAEAWQRLGETTVLVAGSGAPTVAASLSACGIDVAVGTDDLVDSDLLVVAWRGDEPVPHDLLDAARAAQVPALLSCAGEGRALAGPLLLPGISPCHRCALRAAGPVRGAPEPEWQAFWTHRAALDALHLLARTAGPPQHHYNAVQVAVDDPDGVDVRDFVAARTPGCADCGLEAARRLDADATLAWALHVTASLPPFALIPPREHQEHYSAANVELKKTGAEDFCGTPVCAPAGAHEIPGGVPWTTVDAPAGGAVVDAALVATLLARTVETNPRRPGLATRVAPSAGGLGTAELFVAARGVDGLADGVWHHIPERGELEGLGNVPDDLLDGNVGCALLGAGRLDRARQKYGGLGYRLVHLDAGVVLADLLDIAAALGARARLASGWDDDRIAHALRIPSTMRYVPTFALLLEAPR